MAQVSLPHGGADLLGEVARPAGSGPHPAVLVMANAYGLGPQTRAAARRLAELGYVALATDMYGGGGYYPERERAGAAAGPLFADQALLRARALAWLDRLAALPGVDPARLGAIGYCFGGQCVLEIARAGGALDVAISFHGLLDTTAPSAPGAVRAEVAVFTGRLDPYVPFPKLLAFRDEMIAAGARWHLTEYGDAWHSFTDPDAPAEPEEGKAFHPLAAAASWASAVALLNARLLAAAAG